MPTAGTDRLPIGTSLDFDLDSQLPLLLYDSVFSIYKGLVPLDTIEDSLKKHPVASPVKWCCCQSTYNRTARRMLLFFSFLLDYNLSCLAKRSRALRGRNPTRNDQVRAGESPALPWRLTPPGIFFQTFIHLPCHPSENPGVWGRAPASLSCP
jgi:hypothetical protein